MGDALPNNICQECLKSLTLSFKFVIQCIEAKKKVNEICRVKVTEREASLSVTTRTRKSLFRKPIVTVEEVVPVTDEKEVEVIETVEDEMRHSDDDAPEDVLLTQVIHDNKNDRSFEASGKIHYCPHCKRAFTNKFRMKNHIRIHTGERPFICNTCNKAFAQPNALKCHIRLHTGEKPYKCPVESCGKTFTQNTTLKTHMAALHIGKAVKCDACDKTFTRASYLTAHKRLEHLGQRPYACHICPNRYKQKSHLDHHLEVHNGVKYVCPICNRKYSKKWSLQVHSFTHLKENGTNQKLPHACDQCEESFARKDKLRAHVITKHGNASTQVKRSKKKIKIVGDQEEVPVPSNVVEVESRSSVILQEESLDVVKEFDARQYHVINITDGELIQEIVIPNNAIFYQDELK